MFNSSRYRRRHIRPDAMTSLEDRVVPLDASPGCP